MVRLLLPRRGLSFIRLATVLFRIALKDKKGRLAHLEQEDNFLVRVLYCREERWGREHLCLQGWVRTRMKWFGLCSELP